MRFGSTVVRLFKEANHSARQSHNGPTNDQVQETAWQAHPGGRCGQDGDHRAAMGIGLETRVPFLDHQLVEFAWRLPLPMKIRNGQGKLILRRILNKHVPKALVDRPKVGFRVPIDSWLRAPLREWAEALLDEGRLRKEGFFHPEPICRKCPEHLKGQRNWQYYLWSVLMFQAWLEKERAN